ncbi:Putative glycolipid-binding protein [Septoria linicola]|uniref:Glycolipid-binding protein n=1 Tax=Septoria linicola TaxID=215465 RepID=A0A9Q9ATR2_9PEZI|nr:putative glycolipid-binding protein [Septoria linicola]USW50576.1 Putative glycolipid-binding protein [Septoria linicola]
MGKIVHWSDWELEGREDCKLVQNEDGVELEGDVTGTRDSNYQGHYLVRTDASLRTREVVVEYINGPKLHITSDGKGNWNDHATGKPLPSLQGCLDVDFGITPATNTLPIKRLGLQNGQSRDITV